MMWMFPSHSLLSSIQKIFSLNFRGCVLLFSCQRSFVAVFATAIIEYYVFYSLSTLFSEVFQDWELTLLMRQVILKLELHMIHVKPLYFQNIHMTVRRSIAIILDRTVVVPFDSDESF